MPGNPREIITTAERRFPSASGSAFRLTVLGGGIPG
jgi:hypothetical protein